MREGWGIKRLGEIGTVVGGSTPKTNVSSYWGGEHYWITPAELNGSKYVETTARTITDEALAHANLPYLPAGTVLLSSRAPIGKVAITTVPMYCNQGFKNIICGPDINNEYVYWFLLHNKDYLVSLGRGATFKEISKQIVEQVPIPVPPLQVQEKIVAELDYLSDVIAKKQRQLEELDKLAQSIFYDMFGDPIANEKGWEMKRLKDVAVIVGGSTPKTNVEEYWNGENPWVTPAELHQNHYISSTERGISNEAAKGLTLLPIGTVLLSSRAPIGKVSITTIPMYCNQGFKNVICSQALNNEYMYHLLLNKTEYLNSLGTGATFKEISKKTTENIKIAIPPIELQEAFAEQSKSLEQQKSLIKQSITETETLFNSRMDYWFNN